MQTDANTLAAEMIAQIKPDVQCLTVRSRVLASMLDNKIAFAIECQNLGLRVPEFFRINNADELFRLRERGLLSPDRGNFDRIPHEIEELKEYMKRNRQRVAPHTLYYVCEFIKGKEYTSNAICRNGTIYAIQVCPASPIQIDYSVVERKKFVTGLSNFAKKKQITGFICFDFLECQQSGEIYCIECNPRLHSSVVSYQYSSELESAIRDALEADINENIHTKIKPVEMALFMPVKCAHHHLTK